MKENERKEKLSNLIKVLLLSKDILSCYALHRFTSFKEFCVHIFYVKNTFVYNLLLILILSGSL